MIKDIEIYLQALKEIKICIIDMDGTLYVDSTVTPGANKFINFLKETKIPYYFFTNNTSSLQSHYYKKLCKLGFTDLCEDMVHSPLDELVLYFKENSIKNIYLLSTQDVQLWFERYGINTQAKNPEYVVLTYDVTINYEKIKAASGFLSNCVPLLASHPDCACPTMQGPVPDVGAFLAMFDSALHVKPTKIFGKPNTYFLQSLMEQYSISPDEVLVIGDRLYTDIAMACNLRCKSLLTLTGETTIDMIATSLYKPTFIINNFDEFNLIKV